MPGSDHVEEIVASLTGTVRSGDHILQCSAIRALSYFYADAAPAIPVLIQLVREASPGHDDDIVQAAAQTLGMIASDTPAADEVVSVLLSAALGFRSGSRRCHRGTWTLRSDVRDRRSENPFLGDDRDPTVKQAAETALFILLDERDVQTHP